MATTLTAELLTSVESVPDQLAVRLLYAGKPAESLSFARLAGGASAYAAALSGAGVEPGQVVILILDHGPDLLWAFWGAVLQGALPAIMPFLSEKLSPEHYRKSLRALMEVTAPAAVITTPGFLPEVKNALSEVGTGPILMLNTAIQPEEGSIPSQYQGLARTPQDLAVLQHSSGTTGIQKGVALSHLAIFNQLESYAEAVKLTPDDVIVSWLPLYHDMGLIAGFLLPILSRVPLVLMSPFDWVRSPVRLLQAVSIYGGTLSWLPNFAYNFCARKIREADLAGLDLSSWRAVINCSEPMDPASHQAFLDRFGPIGLQPRSLATCYAMAENVFAVTQGGIRGPVHIDRIDRRRFDQDQQAIPVGDGEAALALLSAGEPVRGVEVQVWDGDGAVLDDRMVGEIVLRSNCMLSGYFRRPDLTAEAFRDGWFLTGDLGYLAEGELYITGRKKDLIIVGGKNIYPQDLEELAHDVPGVHPGRVAAFGVYNPESGTEDVVLVAEVEIDDPGARQDIGAGIRAQINRRSEVALRYVELVDPGWLVKTSSGKVARNANREKYLQAFRGQ